MTHVEQDSGDAHRSVNGPQWPKTHPWENYLFALVAVGVLHRRTMLQRAGATTDVLMPREQSGQSTRSLP